MTDQQAPSTVSKLPRTPFWRMVLWWFLLAAGFNLLTFALVFSGPSKSFDPSSDHVLRSLVPAAWFLGMLTTGLSVLMMMQRYSLRAMLAVFAVAGTAGTIAHVLIDTPVDPAALGFLARRYLPYVLGFALLAGAFFAVVRIALRDKFSKDEDEA